ncbi:hypothetical protein BC567DRAFT_48706 [Phyllosticta citribraziliensis]
MTRFCHPVAYCRVKPPQSTHSVELHVVCVPPCHATGVHRNQHPRPVSPSRGTHSGGVCSLRLQCSPHSGCRKE